ncbi:outer membrane beta-barrel protein [Sphingobacterium psychroaquaticum]|nr:outer membrane beta-barrel protein [Sphingobacterium psychroaquaticum]
MKRLFLLFAFFVCCSFTVIHGQTKITGRVSDEADQSIKLKDALAMLLRAKDSILVDFARADENGQFSLPQRDDQDYILVVSYPKYADFYRIVNGKTDTNLGDVKLSSISHLLEEIVVTGRMPITIKGDTTEYDAGSFKVEKNAKVEDLLKVLPGISVDASGKITAQGKTVKKVLVDGEEFFGDDPTLVTRNIRSDMVDKVQVYEKKSDVAERTGVDDGQREQTINVKLKEDAKNGMFGKALGGVGTDKYYMGQLMLNKFKGSQKISAYGLFGNNGTTSMNWQDAQKFGGDSGVSYGDDGATMMVGSSDPFSGEGVVGIPRAINTGVNFSDKFKGDKHKLNLNYKYGRIESDGTEETIQTGIINQNSSRNVDSENDLHRVNLRYDLAFDSLNSLLVSGGASRKNLWTNTERKAQLFNDTQDTVMREKTNELVENKINSYDVNALFTHKFLKKGRSLSFYGKYTNDETSGGGSLYSEVHNFLLSKDTITDQMKNRLQKSSLVQGQVTYTEPLSKVLTLSAVVGLVGSKNSSLLESYNKSGSGNYDELDRRFSNNYDFNRNSNNYKLSLQYITEKLRLNLANSLNNDNLHQLNNYTQSDLKRNFLTYNPSLGGNYNISKSKNLWFNYNGTNRLPSLSQIQPIQDNADPLNRYLGNENLKPAFSNSVNLGYNTFKALSGSYTYIGGYAELTKDPIAQNITVDKSINYYEWQNIDGKTNSSFNMWAGHYEKISKKLGLAHSPQFSLSGSKSYNFFNGELNKVNTTNYNFTYQFMRDTKTGLNFNINLSPQYRVMKSSLQKEINSNGFVFGSNGNVEYFVTKTFKVYVNYNYTYEAPTDAFGEKFEQFLVHPGVSKKFFKNESLVVDFTVNDLLNENKGFSRSARNSVFTQQRFETIRRYYMLKVSWDFTKMFIK